LGLDAAATTVSVTTPGGMNMLSDFAGGSGLEWGAEIFFADFASLQTATNGAWTVSVSGPSPGTLTFNFDTSGLTAMSFFDPATNVSPANGAMGVPLDTNFSWTPPAGGTGADVVNVNVESSTGGGSQDELLDPMTATMWNPAMDIGAGAHEWTVGYYTIGNPALITGLMSTGLTWSQAPDLPPSVMWPTDGTPFFALGGETTVEFNNVPEPGSAALLARRRRG
jgi:hypothetical protein